MTEEDFAMGTTDLDAYQRYCDTRCQPVTEISEAHFNDMLEIMPPLDWHFTGTGGSQSFKLMEMYCGNIACIYAQYGDRFFELRDRVTLAHRDIIARVQAFLAAHTSAV
ncbi:hypothetical protein DP804_19585 [Salmonella enterica subsp. enterica]|nr:hypothetical protein [Salmonella enterica subsp. enterica serovar Virchow]